MSNSEKLTGAKLRVASNFSLIEYVKWCPFWAKLLLISLLVPTEFSFEVSGLRLTPYRLILIFAFLPCLKKFLDSSMSRISSDWLILMHLLWCYIVILYYHGSDVALESGGIRVLELGGAYLIAKTTIQNEKTFLGVMVLICLIVGCLAPILLYESITGHHIIKNFSSALVGRSFYSPIEGRLGLERAYGSFDHPILLGVFAASTLGMTWCIPVASRKGVRHLSKLKKAVILSALTSLSSGALAALMTQLTLLLWKYKFKYMHAKWKVFTLLLGGVYIFIEIFSNRSGIKVLLSYLTFSAGTAYNRINIFNFAIEDVWDNPFLGIGFNDWSRPSWMHSSSMDNFWLVQAVTFGLPGFLTIALTVLILLSKNWKSLSEEQVKLRAGWTISMIGIIVAACTVHLWNSVFVYFSFLIGMGGWFQNIKENRG